jgi:activator of HSP90 ATPase
MYNENIEGEYVSLEENKRITLKWKMKDWAEYSDVVIEFEEDDDVRQKTLLIFIGSQSSNCPN